MKSVIALSLLGLTLAAAPAWSDEQVHKTELTDISGTSVDRLQLPYDFDWSWVIDDRTMLYRGTNRDHYLVTLKEPCRLLNNSRSARRVSFLTETDMGWELKASKSYHLKPVTGRGAGRECDVAAISMIDEARADELREAGAAWRKSRW